MNDSPERRAGRPADSATRTPAGRVRAVVSFGLALLAFVFTSCAEGNRRPGPREPISERPNILVIMWDTVRVDRLGCYGYPEGTTPSIDAFAREATLFENAVSTSCWTLPAHASIFTGLYPSTHRAVGAEGWLSGEFDTLAELLSGAGYDTYLFSANPFVSERHNLTQGFSTVHHPWRDPWRELIRPRTADEERAKVPRERRRFKDAAPVIKDALVQWIDDRRAEERAGRPFFAFLNLMEAHFPWHAPRAVRKRFLPDGLVEHSYRMKHDVKRRFEHLFGVSRMSDRDLEAISGMYDAALWGLDHATGQLLHELESRELLDETVVVLVSDHGEMLGEHGLLGHEYALYQELVHVPLIVRYPQVFPAGRRVEAPVQLNDLYGSLLQLAGVTPPTDLPAAGREHSYGLVDAVEGGHTDRPLLAEYLEPKEERLRVVMRRSPEADIDPTPWLQPLRSWLRGDWKLVWAGDSPRGLFELSADAAESTDLSFEHEERVGRMRDAMRRMVAELEMAGSKITVDAPSSDRKGRDGGGHLERLKALGYVADDEDGSNGND